ncbi:hypothetical protein BHE74_00021892 [Ensete ventricosum]|nr:hypothetical protein BHE74_00021892 [Ensete ventricosum]RZS14641.1 hypothetical protein BHM03_00046358 [Ensete ventricosum]
MYVREEDDVKITKKLQCRLKQRRKRKRKYQVESLLYCSSGADVDHPVAVAEDLKPEIPNKPKNEIPIQNDTIKGSCENEDVELDNKRHWTVIIESDDEVQVIDDKSPSHDLIRDQLLTAQVREVVDVIDSDVLSSPTPANNDILMDIPEKFNCTACSEVLKASEVQRHPTLEVIEHLKSMQAQSVGKFCNTRSNESVGEVSLDDAIEGYIVNIAREKDEEPVRIPQSISAKLKPHQKKQEKKRERLVPCVLLFPDSPVRSVACG